MHPRLRTAITLPGASDGVSAVVALARHAEKAGYDDLWLADAGGLDALTLAAVLAQHTSSPLKNPSAPLQAACPAI